MKVRRVKTPEESFPSGGEGADRKRVQKACTRGPIRRENSACAYHGAIAVTGVRVSELRYFTVEQVKRGRIEVRNKGKYRRIFLTTDIRKKLLCFAKFRKIIKGCIFVTNSGKPKIGATSGVR